jgi:hypothetical protein
MEEVLMKKSLGMTNASRRNFIRGTAAVGVSSLIVSAAPVSAVTNSSQMKAHDKPEAKGYRLTKHILDYYKTLVS